MPFAAPYMAIEIVILLEVSQTEDTYYMVSLIWRKQKDGTNELIYKTEIESQMYKTILWLPVGERGWGKTGRLGITYTHYYI